MTNFGYCFFLTLGIIVWKSRCFDLFLPIKLLNYLLNAWMSLVFNLIFYLLVKFPEIFTLLPYACEHFPCVIIYLEPFSRFSQNLLLVNFALKSLRSYILHTRRFLNHLLLSCLLLVLCSEWRFLMILLYDDLVKHLLIRRYLKVQVFKRLQVLCLDFMVLVQLCFR